MTTIGILNLQGDVSEHFEAMKKAACDIGKNVDVFKVKTSDEVSKCDGIIISGGESTVIGNLMEETGIKKVIVDQNIPVMGTCAGMVLLAKKTDYEQPLLGLIDMEVKRNAFGRQKVSFEDDIEIFGKKFKGIFIRAPYIEKVGKSVDILSKYNERIVAVKSGKYIATAFHPELTGDTTIHEYFIKEVLNCAE
ncbi:MULTISPECIES: pyridoxal 5'-phosphate synthase glutaminase subunit PdxT [Methanobacterium]|uniref:Pyridoxal 5'-phosphate synthase subunit PdxT n=1 Tax=Methanobacterium bryantii TaxID=2161 RepID=A0A2A2H4S0_METBR|nr:MULTISPECIES: pyridoxal 5'-phosphate synthase glutaminase subunit PdxT [Methanobacterium]OEC85592.1 glutamine amidotransferase subunit PdxT [Methanobacterium sp. A39]PAV04306.1 glutamine amidotransferase [Methanobacterium bryantii]